MIQFQNFILCRNAFIYAIYLPFRYGRKIVLFPSYAVMILTGFASGFVNSFWLFFMTRLIIGFTQGGLQLTLFIMASELVGPRYRALSGTAVWFAFTAALCFMGMKAYFIPNWRMLEIVCTIPFIIYLAFYRWEKIFNYIN